MLEKLIILFVLYCMFELQTVLFFSGGGLHLGIYVPAVCANYLYTGSWSMSGMYSK